MDHFKEMDIHRYIETHGPTEPGYTKVLDLILAQDCEIIDLAIKPDIAKYLVDVALILWAEDEAKFLADLQNYDSPLVYAMRWALISDRAENIDDSVLVIFASILKDKFPKEFKKELIEHGYDIEKDEAQQTTYADEEAQEPTYTDDESLEFTSDEEEERSDDLEERVALYDKLSSDLMKDPELILKDDDMIFLTMGVYDLFNYVDDNNLNTVLLEKVLNYFLEYFDYDDLDKRNILRLKAELYFNKGDKYLSSTVKYFLKSLPCDDASTLSLLNDILLTTKGYMAFASQNEDYESYERLQDINAELISEISKGQALTRPDENQEALNLLINKYYDLGTRAMPDIFEDLTDNPIQIYQRLEQEYIASEDEYDMGNMHGYFLNKHFHNIIDAIKKDPVKYQANGEFVKDYIEYILTTNEDMTSRFKEYLTKNAAFINLHLVSKTNIVDIGLTLKQLIDMAPLNVDYAIEMWTRILDKLVNLKDEHNEFEIQTMLEIAQARLNQEGMVFEADIRKLESINSQMEAFRYAIPQEIDNIHPDYFKRVGNIANCLKHGLGFQDNINAYLDALIAQGEEIYSNHELARMILVSGDDDKINQLCQYFLNDLNFSQVSVLLNYINLLQTKTNLDTQLLTLFTDTILKQLMAEPIKLSQQLDLDNWDNLLQELKIIHQIAPDFKYPEKVIKFFCEEFNLSDFEEPLSDDDIVVKIFREYLKLDVPSQQRSEVANVLIYIKDLDIRYDRHGVEGIKDNIAILQDVMSILANTVELNAYILDDRLYDIQNIMEHIHTQIDTLKETSPENEQIKSLELSYKSAVRDILIRIFPDQFYGTFDTDSLEDDLENIAQEYQEWLTFYFNEISNDALSIEDWMLVSDQQFWASEISDKAGIVKNLIDQHKASSPFMHQDRDKWLAIILSGHEQMIEKIDQHVKTDEHHIVYLARTYLKAANLVSDDAQKNNLLQKADIYLQMGAIRGNRYALGKLEQKDKPGKERLEALKKIHTHLDKVTDSISLLQDALAATGLHRARYLYLGSDENIKKEIGKLIQKQLFIVEQGDILARLEQNEDAEEFVNATENAMKGHDKLHAKLKQNKARFSGLVNVLTLGMYPLRRYIQDRIGNAILDSSPLKGSNYQFWRKSYHVIVDLLDGDTQSAQKLHELREQQLADTQNKEKDEIKSIKESLIDYLMKPNKILPAYFKTTLTDYFLEHKIMLDDESKLTPQALELKKGVLAAGDEFLDYLAKGGDEPIPPEFKELMKQLMNYSLDQVDQVYPEKLVENYKQCVDWTINLNKTSTLDKLNVFKPNDEKVLTRLKAKLTSLSKERYRLQSTKNELDHWMVSMKAAYPGIELEERTVRTEDGKYLDVLMIKNVAAQRKNGGVAKDVIHFSGSGCCYHQDSRPIDHALAKGANVMVVMDRLKSPDSKVDASNKESLIYDGVACVKELMKIREHEYAAKGLEYKESDWPIINGYCGGGPIAVLTHEEMRKNGVELKFIADRTFKSTHEVVKSLYGNPGEKPSFMDRARVYMVNNLSGPLMRLFGWETKISKYIDTIDEDKTIQFDINSPDSEAEAVYYNDDVISRKAAVYRGLRHSRDRRIAQIDGYIEQLDKLEAFFKDNNLDDAENQRVLEAIASLRETLEYAKTSFDLTQVLSKSKNAHRDDLVEFRLRDGSRLEDRLFDFVNDEPENPTMSFANLIGINIYSKEDNKQLMNEFWQASADMFDKFYNHGKRMKDSHHQDKDLRLRINELMEAMSAHNINVNAKQQKAKHPESEQFHYRPKQRMEHFTKDIKHSASEPKPKEKSSISKIKQKAKNFVVDFKSHLKLNDMKADLKSKSAINQTNDLESPETEVRSKSVVEKKPKDDAKPRSRSRKN